MCHQIPLHNIIQYIPKSICTSLKTQASTLISTTSRLSAFGAFLAHVVIYTTIEACSQEKGKHSIYSAASNLATSPGSSLQISPNYPFLKEPTFENISILFVESAFLSHDDHLNVLKSSSKVSTLGIYMITFESLELSTHLYMILMLTMPHKPLFLLI